MRVNPKVFQSQNMLGDISLTSCPGSFRQQAEWLMNMITEPQYKAPNYNTITELDKHLILDYWTKYDALSVNLNDLNFRDWFVKRATSPEWIRRARQWLVENQYVFIKEDVAQNAMNAGSRVRNSIRNRL